MNPNQYLTERVSKVVVNSDKLFNHGAYLIAHFPTWSDEVERIINESWDTLLRFCVRNKQANYSAAVKLTFASDLIGKRVAAIIDVDSSDIKNTLGLGDLLLECFLQDNLIEISREYEGIKAPYIVRVKNQADDVKPLLIGTTFEPPMPITGLTSSITGNPFIKGWTDNKAFKEYLGMPFIRALEALRQQPWVLNQYVFDLLKRNPPPEILHIRDEDGVIRSVSIHDVPQKLPGWYHMDGTTFLGSRDPKIQKMVSKFYEYTQVYRKAEMVISEDKPFYQEVSCDYRGRVYYSESFLEFQGGDSARALFLFHNKKPVDNRGLFWMRVHAANCYNRSFSIEELKSSSWMTTDYVSYLEGEGLDSISLDKMTLEDRAKWSELCEDFLINTEQLCEEAEKPFSFAAICNEIREYRKAVNSGNTYHSGFPIPLDGSNNGWQHLAAMSKDAQAGELVSLTAAPIQKDFYVAVAKQLITLMPDWFEERQIPMKHIRKGIAKRGSMTRAYSAGKRRIAKNMYDDCHMEGFTSKYNIDEDQCMVLAGNLIDAINTVCNGPLKTTKFLQKLAEHELSSGQNMIQWVTPSGFPVRYKANLQHERKQRGTIKGIPGNSTGRITHVIKVDATNKETGEKVPCRKSFASGISPNVVHSYDAAHMANTIVAFGGSFAAVHDSFSTHACDVDFLQEVTKLTFIAQYNVDNFFDIIKEVMMTPESRDTFKWPAPSLGKLNIEDINDSKYFFC